MGSAKHPGTLIKLIWRASPAHWPFHAAIAIAASIVLLAPMLTQTLPPGLLFYFAYFLVALAMMTGAVWLLTSIVAPEPRRPGEWRILKWWLGPVIVVALAFLGESDQPFIQFWVERPQLEKRLADVSKALPTTRTTDDGAEVFERGDAHRLPSGEVRLRSGGVGNWFDWNGYAYSPVPLHDDLEHGWQYSHLTGPWYICYGT
jgi:hypothetical protein